MVDLIKQLNDFGWTSVIIIIAIAALLFISAVKTGKDFLHAAGLKTEGSIRREGFENEMQKLRSDIEEQRMNLENYQKEIFDKQTEYHQQSIDIRNNLASNQEDLKNSISELKNMFIKKEIEDMRWELLSFANAIMGGKDYNKEQYDHVLEIHDEYESILENNNMENGKVTVSMAFIKKKYEELMDTGFKR